VTAVIQGGAAGPRAPAAEQGYGVGDMSPPLLLAALVVGLRCLPVLGRLRPDLVSLVLWMRQHAGARASATWASAPTTSA
jgi:hypothetical protein